MVPESFQKEPSKAFTLSRLLTMFKLPVSANYIVSRIYAYFNVATLGRGDLTKLNIPAGDAGGELDPHGADGNGMPTTIFNQDAR